MLRRNVREMLELTVQVVRHGLQIHESVTLHANLMLPMEVLPEEGDVPVAGLGIVEYNTQAPADPSWTKVIQGDILAGTVILDGKVQWVEDTEDLRTSYRVHALMTRRAKGLCCPGPAHTRTQPADTEQES
jgi:hypothetical protein